MSEAKKEIECLGYMFQHEETGQTGFITQWDKDNGFEKHNPRLHLVEKVYSESALRQAIENAADHVRGNLVIHPLDVFATKKALAAVENYAQRHYGNGQGENSD